MAKKVDFLVKKTSADEQLTSHLITLKQWKTMWSTWRTKIDVIT